MEPQKSNPPDDDAIVLIARLLIEHVEEQLHSH
jgi:hypothetical protein